MFIAEVTIGLWRYQASIVVTPPALDRGNAYAYFYEIRRKKWRRS